MDLIVLHGPPGVGKHTIGVLLARQLGYSYLNSHRLMAEVGAVFGWGTPEFLQIRDAAIAAAQVAVTTAALPGLVWTTIFEPTVDLGGWNTLFAWSDRALVVDLYVARAEHARRLSDKERRAAGKAGQIDEIGPLVDDDTFDVPALSAPIFTLDTTGLSAREAVDAIVERLRS
jgi:hypothetical protein